MLTKDQGAPLSLHQGLGGPPSPRASCFLAFSSDCLTCAAGQEDTLDNDLEDQRPLINERTTVQKSLEVAFQTHYEFGPFVCIWFLTFKNPKAWEFLVTQFSPGGFEPVPASLAGCFPLCQLQAGGTGVPAQVLSCCSPLWLPAEAGTRQLLQAPLLLPAGRAWCCISPLVSSGKGSLVWATKAPDCGPRCALPHDSLSLTQENYFRPWFYYS